MANNGTPNQTTNNPNVAGNTRVLTSRHPYMRREDMGVEHSPYFRAWVENRLPVGESVESDIAIYECELREDVQRLNAGAKPIYLVGENKYNGQVPHVHKVYQFERQQLRFVTIMFYTCPAVATLLVMALAKPDARGIALMGAFVTAIILSVIGTIFSAFFLKKEYIDNTPYLAREAEKRREQLKKDFTITSYR